MVLPVSARHGVHMNGGEGITSYGRNSTPQRRAQEKLAPLLEAAVADMLRETPNHTRSIGIADLGCSSGPNTMFLVSTAIDAVRRRCSADDVRVYLNDLPDNDFNTVFRQLPESLLRDSNVFIFGAPGSFFGRLFPAGSLHLAISSFSLHWFSQVPQDLLNGKLVNRGNICAGRTSSPAVNEAYARQFCTDLTMFLSSRAVEMIHGGCLLISLKGRSARDMSSHDCVINDHPTHVLNAMAAQGLLDASRLDSYNIPVYDPCADEVREIVAVEGSFEIVAIESYEMAACDPAGFSRAMRAVHEPMLVRHFGDGIDMGDFVRTAEEHLNVLSKEGRYKGMFVHVLSLRRRELSRF
ncbi:hypothetical protein PR202_ga24643 [Eleusine coracana subsp. coracana]|uniref:Uncharacterized protein n=1 Tax=Eleusine coracana subsp. coracana TaxID=191504 RepID=A0AAV5D8W7_ELECO|nr:hypothetical protein QOZ80_9AG0676420 [Eleusine coracana subsp. coracana]GJN06873.1 hypothetical protein PR202_ga24643 [Eleusine coracana subsp. coracana]